MSVTPAANEESPNATKEEVKAEPICGVVPNEQASE
jgi:hypothetical protein